MINITSMTFLGRTRHVLVTKGHVLRTTNRVTNLHVTNRHQDVVHAVFRVPNAMSYRHFLNVLCNVTHPVPIRLRRRRYGVNIHKNGISIDTHVKKELLRRIRHLFRLTLHLVRAANFTMRRKRVIVRHNRTSINKKRNKHNHIGHLAMRLFNLLMLTYNSRTHNHISRHHDPHLQISFLGVRVVHGTWQFTSGQRVINVTALQAMGPRHFIRRHRRANIVVAIFNFNPHLLRVQFDLFEDLVHVRGHVGAARGSLCVGYYTSIVTVVRVRVSVAIYRHGPFVNSFRRLPGYEQRHEQQGGRE